MPTAATTTATATCSGMASGTNSGDDGRGEAPHRGEQRIEREVVELDRQQDDSENQPGERNHSLTFPMRFIVPTR